MTMRIGSNVYILLGVGIILALRSPAWGADGLPERWSTEPLGPKIEVPFRAAPIKRELQPTLKVYSATGAPVVLVEAGRPTCVLMVADRASEAAKQAAVALKEGLRKMSGAEVAIVQESEVSLTRQQDRWHIRHGDRLVRYLVAIGDTSLAASEKLSGRDLPPEGYRIKTVGNILLLVGSDDDRASLNEKDARALPAWQTSIKLGGSRHAAMALLERHLGFRSLWPGELGEVVPRSSTVSIPALDEEDAPALRRRILRNFGYMKVVDVPADPTLSASKPVQEVRFNAKLEAGLERLGFTNNDYVPIYRQTYPWFERQRQGNSYRWKLGEAYGGWWKRFGEVHPEWFALQRNGFRTQLPKNERLCVSNPGLAQQVIKEKLAEARRDPFSESVSVLPEDGGFGNAYCLCESCRKLDPVNGAPMQLLSFLDKKRMPNVPYVSLSDRYFTYFNQVAEAVAREHPGKMVATLAYSVYRYAPLGVNLHPNLLVGFVGFDYWNDNRVDYWRSKGLEADRESWERWATLARQLYLRPNAFHAGHGMPGVFVTKLARDFKRCFQTGMIAADFDACLQHWATQGLNYYVLAKLMWDPSLDVEAIVQDYCQKGFGKAAAQVRTYFSQLEELTSRVAAAPDPDPRAEKSMRDDYVQLMKFYTPEAIADLRRTLGEARSAAGDDDRVRDRIDFLAAGLRYAELQAAVHMMPLDADKSTLRRLLAERYTAFRELFQTQPFAVNVAFILWREGGMWNSTGWAPAEDR